MIALIVGGGKLGATVAHSLLAADHDVTVIDNDDARIDELASMLPGATIVAGDGNEPVVLEKASIVNVDTVLALTGDDEDNLVVCLLAKREYGVSTTFGRVNDVRNQWLFDARFGVDVPVSGTHLAADLVLAQLGTPEVPA